MALMHRTTMVPSKLDLLAAWLPSQTWFEGDPAALKSVGAYRLDDPEGEVGIEGHLLTAGNDTVYHVPLTYRGTPLEEGERFLVGTSEHGVLGTRWISDAIGDPVFRAVLAQTTAQGGHEAEQFVRDAEGNVSRRESRAHVRGSGTEGAPVPELWSVEVTTEGAVTRAETGLTSLQLLRVLDPAAVPLAGMETLTATWPGQEEPVLLATLE